MEAVKNSKKLERTVLDAESVQVIKKMIAQVVQELGDTVSVSQKTMVNFIIKSRSPILSSQELEKLKSENYDLIKALKRATDEAIKAKKNGSEIQMNEIIKLIQTPGVSENSPLKKPRGRMEKENTSATTKAEKKSKIDDNKQLDLVKNDISEIQITNPELSKIKYDSTFELP